MFTFEYHELRQKEAAEEFARRGDDDVIVSLHGDACAVGFVDAIVQHENASRQAAGQQPLDAAQLGRPLDWRDARVDAVFLDLPTPWLALPHADRVLVPGGKLVTFCPCIEQVAKVCDLLRSKEYGYRSIVTYELLQKPWSRASGVLKQLPMRGHTSYLTMSVKPGLIK